MRFDLLLIHPPSYFYFRESGRFFGPIADVVPSTPVFDMYPYGFFSIAYHLARRGYSVAIHNAAALMVLEQDYSFESFLRGVEAKLYGVDLHWLVHAHGALETAKVIKRVKGEVPVVLGGLTASIYWHELIVNHPYVDYVLTGDTVEPALEPLVEVVEGARRPSEVPGLAYREGGAVRLNPRKPDPPLLDGLAIDFEYLFRYALRHPDPLSFIPFAAFFERPIGAVLSFKGCAYNCATCGGSKMAYKLALGRTGLSRKSPDVLAHEILSIARWGKLPVFVVGDLQLVGGESFASRLTSLLRQEGFDCPILFEFFAPPPRGLLEVLSKASHEVILQISPETQDEGLRATFGRPYSNEALKRLLERCAHIGFSRVDLYFMHGIPFQTYEAALGLPHFVEGLLREFNRRVALDVFVAPLAPFLDPGSLAFVYPEAYGYRLRARSIAEHVKLIEESPSWVEMLNYESVPLPPHLLARATAETALGLLECKARYGVLEEDDARTQAEVIREYLEGGLDKRRLEKVTTNLKELYPSTDLGRLLRDKKSVEELIMKLLLSQGRL